MPIDRLRLRAALRIHDVYLTRAVKSTEQFLFDQLSSYDHALAEAREALGQAASAGASLRAMRVRQRLRRMVHAVERAVNEVLCQPHPPAAASVNLRTILAELQQLADEFGDVAVDGRCKTVTVITEPITLNDVYLGSFAIRLDWNRLSIEAGAHCFEVDALEPNPSATNEEVTHPHVTNGGLCAGDASFPIRRALEQGRLADAFLLVRQVLTTYNPYSAYVLLDSWSGTECRRCGRTAPDEQSWCCDNCENELCADCALDCRGCETIHCRACLTECDQCTDLYCGSCLSSEAHPCNTEDEDLEEPIQASGPATCPASDRMDGQPEFNSNAITNPEDFHDTPEFVPV
jgi:hypothetical protein